MCCCSEAGLYLRPIDSCITQRNAQGPWRTCNESKEEEEAWGGPPPRPGRARRPARVRPRAREARTRWSLSRAMHKETFIREIHFYFISWQPILLHKCVLLVILKHLCRKFRWGGTSSAPGARTAPCTRSTARERSVDKRGVASRGLICSGSEGMF